MMKAKGRKKGNNKQCNWLRLTEKKEKFFVHEENRKRKIRKFKGLDFNERKLLEF